MRSLASALLLCLVSGAPLAEGTDTSASPSTIVVHGRVVDELGAPIAGASVAISTERSHQHAATTNGAGEFTAVVPESVPVRLAAQHPDYGLQHTDMSWQGWSRYDVIPPTPIVLTLRRGVVLRGRLLDVDGHARAHERLLLIVAYIGSGPRPIEASTDAAGDFVFERAVLNDFELVVQSVDQWHPEMRQVAGDFLRIPLQRDEWLAHARADEPITVRLEPFTLIRVTVHVTDASGAVVARTDVGLWIRGGVREYVGTMPRTDAHGVCRTLMERSVPYELWVVRNQGARTAPWTQGVSANWQGSVVAATDLTIAIP